MLAGIPISRALALLSLATLAGSSSHLLHLVLSFGLFGLFLVSIVDSSFVPLPLPGITDIMVILFAAQHANLFLLIAAATIGSALGGLFSYQVGQSGGLDFIEKRTPPRIFKRVTGWMESHAILAVAVPALLPPPMPLSPFVLAAGALKMSRKKFMWAFTLSRLIRHAFAAWLGVHYGKAVLVLWNAFIRRWGAPVLIILWVAILGSVAFAFWRLWKTSHEVGLKQTKPLNATTT
ncbi:SNARE associated Golgi protein-related protein [Granulicella tundricola MP5ACTX9]|uniref:SNARE associated Golgi protein-related protein n=2 Tax=Granulicella TaxID=940557 RepID=E8WXV2_GRATM|nr:SNARE associated Golgi protein-related protein [Granulicella tundricola MP5ACTX9]